MNRNKRKSNKETATKRDKKKERSEGKRGREREIRQTYHKSKSLRGYRCHEANRESNHLWEKK
jgi:hypothetical protein